MEKVAFGKTGLQVSRLGFGGAPIGYLKTDQERAGRILNLLLDNGVNLIDTAANYPGSEALIAGAIGHRREQFILVSKCGTTLPDLQAPHWSAEMVAATVERSLKTLKTDHLDVMLLHSCDMPMLQRGEALGALVKAREAGKIRFAGYSGDNEAALFAVNSPEVAVLQTSVNLVDQNNLRKVLPKAIQSNIGVMAKRPIANAAWKDLEAQSGLYRTYAKTYHDRIKSLKFKPSDVGFADSAWPELALRYTLSQTGVHTAIIGTTNPENALTNIGYVKKGPLPADVVKKIDQAYRAADPEGKWMGQT